MSYNNIKWAYLTSWLMKTRILTQLVNYLHIILLSKIKKIFELNWIRTNCICMGNNNMPVHMFSSYTLIIHHPISKLVSRNLRVKILNKFGASPRRLINIKESLNLPLVWTKKIHPRSSSGPGKEPESKKMIT